MAHLVETLFYVGQVPWHGLGEHLTDAPNTKEAIIAAGLDWEIKVQPIYTPEFIPLTMKNPLNSQGGTDIVGEGIFGDSFEKVSIGGVVRRVTDGAMLGIAGPRWTPFQNREAFAWFDPFVEKGLARLHTAGSLDGGKVVWVLAQIGSERAIVGNDTVGQFLLLSVGHSAMSGSAAGPSGIRVVPTPIRVVCANTLSMASRDESAMVKIAHHQGVQRKMEDLQEFIGSYLHDFDKTFEVFKELAHKELSTVMVEEFLKELFPAPQPDENGRPRNDARAQAKREAVEELFAGLQIGDTEIGGAKRSAWSMYSAVTEWVDHKRGRDETRMAQAWYGMGPVIKEKALKSLIAI